MSYAIGKRLYELRIERKISQEESASSLGISRQRFARIENGQSEISYPMLEKAAAYLAVPVREITCANKEVDLNVYFRDVDHAGSVESSVGKIVEILKIFHAHEKLYYRMKEKEHEI